MTPANPARLTGRQLYKVVEPFLDSLTRLNRKPIEDAFNAAAPQWSVATHAETAQKIGEQWVPGAPDAPTPAESDRERALRLVCEHTQWNESTPSAYVKAWADRIATEFAAIRAEASRKLIEEAAHLAEITIHLSMGPATAEEVCEHLAEQRKLIAERIRALAASEPKTGGKP